jgi:hypothetical protein
MSAITEEAVDALERDATTQSISEIASYLQEQLGQRVTAYLAGLTDVKQIGRYARRDGPEPRANVDRRLREGYKVVRLIATPYDTKTAKAWLFGTNTRLDDNAPIELLGRAESTADFIAVQRAARQFASIDG